MEIEPTEDGWVFSKMGSLMADLFRMLPGAASAEDDASMERIFSGPTGGKEPEIESDWREYVVPDLRKLFQSHVDVVSADLAAMDKGKKSAELLICNDHARAWVHTLNQARLALAARHEINEESSSLHSETQIDSVVSLQMDLYGTVLSLLLDQTEF